MMTNLLLCGLLCCPLSLIGQAPAGTAAPLIAVRSARMLDVKTGEYVRDSVVLIQNGRITGA